MPFADDVADSGEHAPVTNLADVRLERARDARAEKLMSQIALYLEMARDPECPAPLRLRAGSALDELLAAAGRIRWPGDP